MNKAPASRPARNGVGPARYPQVPSPISGIEECVRPKVLKITSLFCFRRKLRRQEFNQYRLPDMSGLSQVLLGSELAAACTTATSATLRGTDSISVVDSGRYR